MELQYQITKEQLIVPMPKEVDHHIAKTISREIDFLIDSWHVRKLIFDFAETDFMDSSGIGLVMGRYKVMQQNGGEVEVTHVPKYISRVFKLSGLEQLGVMEKKARPQKRNTEEEADNETR